MNMNRFNDNLKGMLIGCFFSNVHIEKVGQDKAFITIKQTIKHEYYVKHIYKLLSDVGVGLHYIKYYSIKDSRYSETKSIYFKTHNSKLLYPFANMFL
jgi:hypothetical protein